MRQDTPTFFPTRVLHLSASDYESNFLNRLLRVLYDLCVRAPPSILTAGHLGDPAGRPQHSQTQHRAVDVDLVLGESGFDPHGDSGRKARRT